jgi:hypothetical protein
VNEIAGFRARCELAVRAPTHFAYARQHICDGLLLAMMVNSRAGTLLDLKQAAPQRRFDAELRRNCSLALRAGRLQRALVEFTGVNDTNCRRIAHRFTRGYRSMSSRSDHGSQRNLAVRSGSLYPTLVDVGRALVARTQTLVWAKRLNFPGGNGFGTCNFTAERGGLSSTLLRFRRTEAPQHGGGLAPREAFGIFLGDHFIPVGKMGVGADEEPAHENGRGTDE